MHFAQGSACPVEQPFRHRFEVKTKSETGPDGAPTSESKERECACTLPGGKRVPVGDSHRAARAP
eukprot:2054103-Alexandrium_andersonii.AAC.1